ncbi:hypothetical protein B0A52_02926 [Exophiala mesophila]|uniref:F-box domain-containing protein n=1 Tax=Exophiala mesophila TaxID=212818 RepID=A0A438NCF8_EXOME|nr:hypothetical protein B0A52_02926 [Exophiala mesophila]
MATEAAHPLAGILDLEVEILADIFQFIVLESPWSVPAVRRVNKHFRDVIALVQDRQVDLTWSDQHGHFVRKKHYRFNSGKRNGTSVSSPPYNATWKNNDVLQRVRLLTIAPFETSPTQPTPNITTELVDILKTAKNVKTLKWLPSTIPSDEVIKALSVHHPTAQLIVNRMSYCYHAVGGVQKARLLNLEDSLASSTNLSMLGIRGHADHHAHGIQRVCSGSHVNYPKIIASAPSLKTVSIIDCRVPLQNNMANDAELNKITQRSKTIRHLTLEMWPLCAKTLDFWNRIVDLSYLETLKHTRGEVEASYFPRAAQLLTGLRHFSLNMRAVADVGSAEAEAARLFVTSCSPLTTLSLWSWIGIVSLDAIMQQHGPTLTALHLHEREEIWPVRSRKVLSLDDIRLIRTSCPNLKIFTFDLRRQSRQPKIEDYRQILEEIRHMNLEHLEIYLDSGLLYLSIPVQPHIDDLEQNDDDEDIDGDEDEEDGADSEKQILLVNHCGGAYTQAGLTSRRIPKELELQAPPGMELLEEETYLHPPSAADDICEFAGDVWKFVFAARKSGPRLLDMKFGEWERVTMPRLYQVHFAERQKDVRTWVRARPHERDDLQGQCFAQLKCCQGKHWKCWTTT